MDFELHPLQNRWNLWFHKSNDNNWTFESYIKSIEEREYLFDLDAGAKGLLAKYGRSDELDLIFKSYSNLLRLLGN